jgi:ligand-binding sensor domain-containing protein
MVWRLQREQVQHQSLFMLLVGLFLLVALSACSSNAGIFNSGSWQKTGLQYEHIRALAVNSDNPAIVYAGDAQGHMFLSTDAARSWSEHSAGLPVPVSLQELVFNASVKKLYAVTDKGIFVSNDTVSRWTSLLSSGSVLSAGGYTALDFDASKPGNLYVGTAHSGVFASTNGGISWFAASNGLPKGAVINDVMFDADQHQLWAATSAGVYRSADGGLSWSALDKGLPGGTEAYVVQAVSGTPALVYLGTNRGFYRSQNAGASWSASKDNLAAASIRQILVDFRNNSGGTTLYIGTDTGVFRSDNGGLNWVVVGPGLPRSRPVDALALGAANYSQLYAVADNVYQYPGNSTGLSPSRFIAIVIISFFFFTLYQMARRNRWRNKVRPFPPSARQTPASERKSSSSQNRDA